MPERFLEVQQSHAQWEGNPVFESDFKAYYESLKNRDSPDCICIVSASDKHIYIWNAAMGDLEGHVMRSLQAVVIPES